MTKWKNIKTEGYYALLAHGIDCTNARDGLPVVVYSPENNPHMIFVREEKEFYQKFEPAGEVKPGHEPWNKKRED